MARIFLEPDEQFVLASSGSAVFGGAAGNEGVRLQAGVDQTVFDGNVERIELAQASADVVMAVNEVTGRLEIRSGTETLASFSGGLAGPVDLRFSDGSAALTQTGANRFSLADPFNPSDAVAIDPGNSTAADVIGVGSTGSGTGGPDGSAGGDDSDSGDGRVLALATDRGIVDLTREAGFSDAETVEVATGTTAVMPASALIGSGGLQRVTGSGDVRITEAPDEFLELDRVDVTGSVSIAAAAGVGTLEIPARALDPRAVDDGGPFEAATIRGSDLSVVRLIDAPEALALTGSWDFSDLSVPEGIDVDVPVAGAVQVQGSAGLDVFKLTETLAPGSVLSGGDPLGGSIVVGENPQTPVQSLGVDVSLADDVAIDDLITIFLEGNGTTLRMDADTLTDQAVNIVTMNDDSAERTDPTGSGPAGQTLVVSAQADDSPNNRVDLSALTFDPLDIPIGRFFFDPDEDAIRIEGSAADDDIVGTSMADVVVGGEGRDRFEVAPAQGGGRAVAFDRAQADSANNGVIRFDGPVDRIVDFTFGEDVLSLTSDAIQSDQLSSLEDFKVADETDVGMAFGVLASGDDGTTFTIDAAGDELRDASLDATEADALDVVIYADREGDVDNLDDESAPSFIVLESPVGTNGDYLTGA